MKILLKKIRLIRGLSLRQVERMTGISRSALERIECGEVSPTMQQMEKLAIGLHVKIVDLFESAEKM